MSRQFLTLVFAFGVACRATHAPGPVYPSSDTGPGASWLAALRLRPELQHWRVTIRGARDSADRPLSEKTVSQALVAPAEAGEIVITSAWPPPLTSIDSIVIAPRGLRPVREALAYNGFTRRYQYAGNRVWGTVQHADSAPRVFDRQFAEPVFAFSEVDLLVSAVPWRRDWSIVLPLFSESDEDVEHDTITVLAPTRVRRNGRDEDAWAVRFADPAIISTYVVLAGSREIESIDTEQRRSHAVIRYRERAGLSPF